MIQFVTQRNDKELLLSCSFTSLAKQYREVKFYILNQDDSSKIFQIRNTQPQAASVSKKDLYENSLLLIRLQCIVSKDVLDQKETILKTTLVDYTVQDDEHSETYLSDYSLDPTEYQDKTKYTFVISKYIPINFES